MTHAWKVALLAGVVLACPPADRETDETAAADQPAAPTRVAFETTMGRMVYELYDAESPETVRNFVTHVRSGFYDGLTWYRIRPGFIIQAGLLTPDLKERTSTAPPIFNEAENGLKNLRGTVAMARTGDAHSALTDFFINLADNPTLDFKDRTSAGYGYAVFGTVVEGMDVVDAIAQVPLTRKSRFRDIPVEPIVIERAYVVDADTSLSEP